jgi:hypothetical protein
MSTILLWYLQEKVRVGTTKEHTETRDGERGDDGVRRRWRGD